MYIESRSEEGFAQFVVQPEPLPTTGSHALFQFRSVNYISVCVSFTGVFSAVIGLVRWHQMSNRSVPSSPLTPLTICPSSHQIALTAGRPFGITLVRNLPCDVVLCTQYVYTLFLPLSNSDYTAQFQVVGSTLDSLCTSHHLQSEVMHSIIPQCSSLVWRDGGPYCILI